ncbi:MAG: aminotransferase class IV [Cytophagales bacterium]|nr:aminotransferase class IV [Cytophagales bacterium]
MVKCILNNKIVNCYEAFIHISDLTLLRGYGVFDFFRLVGLEPLYFHDHIERFFHSADALRLKCPVGRKKLISMILELIETNNIRNSGIRIVLTGGASETGYSIGDPSLFVINEPINPLPKDYFANGIKLITHEYSRDLPEVKSINYLMGIYKLPEIKKMGALDLLFHWNGKISEVTRSNFFIVDKDDRLITARHGVLKGINRKHVISMAKERYIVEERDLYLEELAGAKEAFITGTTKKVMPVCQVDDILIGNGKPGPTTVQLQKMYEGYTEEFLKTN